MMVEQICKRCKHELWTDIDSYDNYCPTYGGIFFILKAETKEERKLFKGDQKSYIGKKWRAK